MQRRKDRQPQQVIAALSVATAERGQYLAQAVVYEHNILGKKVEAPKLPPVHGEGPRKGWGNAS